MDDHGIHEHGDEHRVGEVCFQPATLSHGTRDNGGSSGSKGPLEKEEGEIRIVDSIGVGGLELFLMILQMIGR